MNCTNHHAPLAPLAPLAPFAFLALCFCCGFPFLFCSVLFCHVLSGVRSEDRPKAIYTDISSYRVPVAHNDATADPIGWSTRSPPQVKLPHSNKTYSPATSLVTRWLPCCLATTHLCHWWTDLGASAWSSCLAGQDSQDARRCLYALTAVRPRLGAVVWRRGSFHFRANPGQLTAESLRRPGGAPQGPEGYQKVSITREGKGMASWVV